MGLPYAMHQTVISLDGAAKMARKRIAEVTLFRAVQQRDLTKLVGEDCDVFEVVRLVVRDVHEQRHLEGDLSFLADAIVELRQLGLRLSQAKELALDLANDFQQTLNAACSDYDFRKVKLMAADLLETFDVVLTICDDPAHYKEQASCLW